MNTFDMFWRGLILAVLALLTWSNLVAGGLASGILLLSCIPVWLFIGLYNRGYF
jgi:hypothetical protein